MLEKSILDTLDIKIGDFFIFENNLWERNSRYSAKTPDFGSCRFGYIGEKDGIRDEEYKEVLEKAKPLSFGEIEAIVLRSKK